MRLAKALHKTEQEIDLIDSQELSRWIAYDHIEGLAPVDSWQQFAQLCWVLAACHGNGKKVKETDFDPYYRKPPRPVQTGQEQLETFKLMFPNAIIK